MGDLPTTHEHTGQRNEALIGLNNYRARWYREAYVVRPPGCHNRPQIHLAEWSPIDSFARFVYILYTND